MCVDTINDRTVRIAYYANYCTRYLYEIFTKKITKFPCLIEDTETIKTFLLNLTLKIPVTFTKRVPLPVWPSYLVKYDYISTPYCCQLNEIVIIHHCDLLLLNLLTSFSMKQPDDRLECVKKHVSSFEAFVYLCFIGDCSILAFEVK